MGIGNRQTEQGKSQLVFVDVLDPSRDNAGKIGKLLLTTPAGTEALRQYICRTWSFDKSVELNHDGVGQVLFASGRLTVPASMVKKARRRLGWKPSHDIPRRHEVFHPLINRILRESERQS